MQWDFNLYAVTLLGLGVAAALLSLIIVLRLSKAVRWFALTLACCAIWVFFYGMELASGTLTYIEFWLKFKYIGISLLPFTWLIFCFRYTGQISRLEENPIQPILLVIALITYVLVATNDWHHLYYTSVEFRSDGPILLADRQRGPLIYMFTFYFYAVVAWGIYLLAASMRGAEPLFRSQTFLLLIAALIPLLFHVMSFVGLKLLGPINVTSFAFTVSFLATGIGLVKYDLFNIVPIAKEELIAAMSDGVLVIDAKDRIVEVNPAMKKVLKEGRQSVIGLSIHEVFVLDEDLIRNIREKQSRRVEINKVIDAAEKTFLIEMIPLKGRKGLFEGMLLVFKDITEGRQSQTLLEIQAAQLKKDNALKDKLFSIISHDLKGPVLGVKEILDLTKNGYINTEELLEILPSLSTSIDGVAMLLENLLAWSRSQLKGEFTDKAVFDIYKLVQTQRALAEPVAALKQVSLAVDSEGSIMVFADKHMVELVIRNLLNNAIKFCDTGDQVLIRVTDHQGEVKISVRDTGVGISAANLQRLRKGDSFTTFGSNNEAGTGLGLLLVRDYVEKNGGTLWIDSEENKWSEFSFVLPKINDN